VLSSPTLTLVGKKLVAVALLAVLGLVVGRILTHAVPRSYVYVDVYSVPGRHADAPRFAAQVRSLHVQGVRVRVHDAHAFQVAGHGSSAQAAVRAAMTVRNAIADMPHPRYNVISGGAVDPSGAARAIRSCPVSLAWRPARLLES